MFAAMKMLGKVVVDEIRIRLHLMRVEQQLRRKNVSHLPQVYQDARVQRLDHLHNYWKHEPIPRNFGGQERSPRFIDRDGGKCAVAHLMIESGHKDTAMHVVQVANDAYINDMDFVELDQWAEASGLTRDELALIQPTYCPIPDDASIVGIAALVYGVSILVALAGFPFSVWNIGKGFQRDIGNSAIKSGRNAGITLMILSAVIMVLIISGNDVLFDMRFVDTSFGWNETCEAAAERLVNRANFGAVFIFGGIGFAYLMTSYWRLKRGKLVENLPNEV